MLDHGEAHVRDKRARQDSPKPVATIKPTASSRRSNKLPP